MSNVGQVDGSHVVGNQDPVDIASRFLTALFAPGDLVLVRPTETWKDGGRKKSHVHFKYVEYVPVSSAALEVRLPALIKSSEGTGANLFFGVCPRRGGGGHFDQKWQIQTVRALWADLDNVPVNEALARCCDKDVPTPSIVVHSGHGVHLYWLLDAPIQIDDGPEPPPVQTEFVEQSDGKKLARRYFVEDGDRVYLGERREPWPLTPKAQHVEDILSGIASKIGGDHTHDLSRLLRLPGPPNRKDQRNGVPPAPTELVECEPSRRYALAEFEQFAGQSPLRLQRERVALVPLKRPRQPSAKRLDGLSQRVVECAVAAVGHRSEADFALCCFAIRNGIPKETAWENAQVAGKFAEAGRSYFDRTWGNAEHDLRLHRLETVERRAARLSGESRLPINAGPDYQAENDAPEILVDTDELRVGDEAIAALSRQGRIYQRSGVLVQVVRELEVPKDIRRAPNSPRIVVAQLPRVRELLSAAATWITKSETPGGDECTRVQRVPNWLPPAVAARGEYLGIRPIVAVVEAPVLRPNGTVLQTPGYDAGTGLLYEPQQEFPAISEHPTREAAQDAAKELLDVVRDFPFATTVHRSAWLAAVLTPLARHAFSGPTPLFLSDANVAGSGKSMLCDLVANIVTGRDIARTSQPEKEEEFRKRVTAIAVAGDPLMLLDNVDRPLGGATLDALLTATSWKDRVLGATQMTSDLPLSTVWFASGNNVVLQPDTTRRCVHMRLESPVEKPEERKDFQELNLVAWTKDNRARLVSAALTILRAYISAGRPQQDLRAWGSYEGWSALVRQAIVWVGLHDPGETRQELQSTTNSQAAALRVFLQELEAVAPQGTKVKSLLRRLQDEPEQHEALRTSLCELCHPRDGADLPRPGSLGSRFSKLRGRVVGGRCLASREQDGIAIWFSKQIATGQRATDPGSTGSSGSSTTLLQEREKETEGGMMGNIVVGGGHERTEEPVEPVEPENKFSNAREELFSWALTLRVDDLPPTPFRVRPHGEVSNAAVWLANVQSVIRDGRNRVQLDDVRRDLQALRQLLSLRN